MHGFGGNRIVSGISIPSVAAPTVIGGAGSGSQSTQPNAPLTTSPINIANLIGWWDFAGQYSTITLSGSNITSITDGSNSGNTYSNGTAANAPTKQTAAQNGLNVARFTHGTASGSYLTNTFASDISDHTFASIFAIRTSQAVNDCIFVSYSPANGAFGIEISNDGTYELASYVNASGAIANTGRGSILYEGKYNIVITTYNSTTHVLNYWMSNPQVGALRKVSTGSVTGAKFPNTHETVMGHKTTNSANMDVGEIALWNRALSDSEVAQVAAYLSSRWNVSWPLTNTNPVNVKFLHWDFSGVSSTVTWSGTDLVTVTDGSGYGYTGAPGTTYKATRNVAALNGLDTITLAPNNTTACTIVSANLNLQDISSYTAWYVIKPNANITGEAQFGGSYSSRQALNGFQEEAADGTKLSWASNGINTSACTTPANSFIVGGSSLANANWYIVCYNYLSNLDNSGTALITIYINNVSKGTASQKYGGISGTDPIGVGSDLVGVTAARFDMGEHFFYNYSQSVSDMTTIFNALKTKWAL